MLTHSNWSIPENIIGNKENNSANKDVENLNANHNQKWKKETPPKSDVNLNSMELETKEVKVQEPVPLSTLKQEVVEPVVETKKETPVQQQPKSPFQEKLEKLEEMGFTDREKNIAILIEKEGDVLNAVRALLANNWIRFAFGENQKKEQICKKFKK